MSDTKGSVRRDHRGVDGAVEDAEGKPKGNPKGKAKSSSKGSRGRQGVTADQAKATEHVGSKGERAFGTPIRDRQTTDSNNE